MDRSRRLKAFATCGEVTLAENLHDWGIWAMPRASITPWYSRYSRKNVLQLIFISFKALRS